MRRELAWTCALLLLSGALGLLPKGREPEELTLLTQLAVEKAGEEVVLTALAGGRAEEGEDPELLTGRGPTLSAAVEDLTDPPLRRPYLGQTEALLVGCEWAGEMEELLSFVLDHPDLKVDTTIYVTQGRAGEVLAAWAKELKGKTRAEDREARTVGETLALLSQGRRAVLPVLALDREGNVVRRGKTELDGGKTLRLSLDRHGLRRTGPAGAAAGPLRRVGLDPAPGLPPGGCGGRRAVAQAGGHL